MWSWRGQLQILRSFYRRPILPWWRLLRRLVFQDAETVSEIFFYFCVSKSAIIVRALKDHRSGGAVVLRKLVCNANFSVTASKISLQSILNQYFHKTPLLLSSWRLRNLIVVGWNPGHEMQIHMISSFHVLLIFPHLYICRSINHHLLLRLLSATVNKMWIIALRVGVRSPLTPQRTHLIAQIRGGDISIFTITRQP